MLVTKTPPASPQDNDSRPHWYVLRDLTRRNARVPGYRLLSDNGFRVFTPMTERLVVRQGRRQSQRIPYMQDLLFAYADRRSLDPIIARTPTLQYRYVCGGWCEPMVVPQADMERFIGAVNAASSVRYFTPDELTPAMYGRRVRIVGGPMDGYEGNLLAVRGSKYRRLLVELPACLIAAVEIEPDFVALLE